MGMGVLLFALQLFTAECDGWSIAAMFAQLLEVGVWGSEIMALKWLSRPARL